MIEAADLIFQIGWRLAVAGWFLALTLFTAGVIRRMLVAWRRSPSGELVEIDSAQLVNLIERSREFPSAKDAVDEFERLVLKRQPDSGLVH